MWIIVLSSIYKLTFLGWCTCFQWGTQQLLWSHQTHSASCQRFPVYASCHHTLCEWVSVCVWCVCACVLVYDCMCVRERVCVSVCPPTLLLSGWPLQTLPQSSAWRWLCWCWSKEWWRCWTLHSRRAEWGESHQERYPKQVRQSEQTYMYICKLWCNMYKPYLPMDYEHWDLGSIFAEIEYLIGLEQRRIKSFHLNLSKVLQVRQLTWYVLCYAQ